MSFSFSLYGMRSLGLDEALATCAKIGYDGVELPLMSGWPAEPAQLNKQQRQALRRRLSDLHLQLPALMENLPLTVDDRAHRQQLERLRAAVALGRDLAPDNLPVIETILGGRPGQWEQLRQRFVERLGQFAPILAQGRTTLAIKPHRGNAMNRPEQTVWLLEQVKSPWIKLAYDYSHFQHRDITLADSLRVMLPHTCFVHVKDVEVNNGRSRFLLPGDGTIDYVALLRGLQQGNYRGTVCVEVSGQVHGQKGYNPRRAAQHCYENLAPAFAKAGIRRG